MHKLEVLLEENAFGSVRPIEVVADTPISVLVSALVEQLNLPQTDLFGKTLVYSLRQSSGRWVLPENATLLSSGIGSGETLALDSHVLEGPPGVFMQNGQGQAYADPSVNSSLTIADGFGPPIVPSFPMGHNTSGKLPTIKKEKERNWPRRAFLAASGGVFVVGIGFSVTYAASSGLLHGLLTGQTQKPPRPIIPVRQSAPPAPKSTVPTKAKLQFTFTQHQGAVNSISWSPDGKMLASAGDDMHVYTWEPNGKVQRNIQYQMPVHAVAWSPDSQRLVTGAGPQVNFLNAQTGTVLGQPAASHNQTVTSVAWTGHGQMQAVSGGMDLRAFVWDTTTYQPVGPPFALHSTSIQALTWSSDGQTVASSSHVIRVWNAANKQEVHPYFIDGPPPGTQMQAAAFAPDGGQLVTGGDDGMLRFWNGLVCQMPGPGVTGCMDVPQRVSAAQGAIRSLTWSPNGRYLAVGAEDGMFSVWDANAQKLLFKVPQNGVVTSVVWSPDGKQLATAAGNTVSTWLLM